jgi:DNA-binding NarL/FixJ family response regulator
MPPKQQTGNGKTRIFLVDDHPIIRRALQMFLNREPNFMVCGEADNGPAALQQMLTLKPDVAIVDLLLKGSSGVELIKQVRAQGLSTKLLVFTTRTEGIHAERALRAGADGYVTKEEGPEKVTEALQLLLQGKRYVSPALAEKMVHRLMNNGSGTESAAELLSDRELEVLELIGRGQGSREIASALHVSIKTVESHREHIKTKLGLTRATELVSYAFNWLRDEKSEPGGTWCLAVFSIIDSGICPHLPSPAWTEGPVIASALQLMSVMFG